MKAALSSLHLLFAADDELATARAAGLLLRHQVQFHWHNRHPQNAARFADFDDFLVADQDKRRNPPGAPPRPWRPA